MLIPETIREQVLINVIDNAPFPIGVYTGHKLKIVLANKCMIKTYGKGPDVIGTNYTDILPELENQQIFGQLRGVLATGEPFEAKNARVDIVIEGVLKPHYFNYNFTPIFDQDGCVFGVMNTAAEVTELNVSRQETLEAEKKLRMAVESAELGTFEIDLFTGTLNGSQSFFRFFETDDPEFNLSNAVSCIHPDDIPNWNAALDSLTSKGRISCEVRLINKGIGRWIRLTGALSESDNKENVVVGVAQDITEEKEYTRELSRLVDQQTAALRRSNQDLKQFGHVLSHDLKEPIRKILLFSKRLEDFIGTDTSKELHYAGKVKKSTQRLSNMIDSILEYSSSDSESLNDTINLQQLLDEIKEDFELKIQEKNATISYGLLPKVKGSKILFHQLFSNLLSNALKFVRQGVTPAIMISHTISKYELKIFVDDNGIGIDANYYKSIFDTFQRLHNKEEYEGTGLGLALCKKIVERHGGQITAATAQGNGTRFQISLPISMIVA